MPADSPTLHVAPQELTFRFTEGQSIDPTTLSGIQITRAGANGQFYDPVTNPNDKDDVVITPGWVGVGDKPNEVIVRFAENLPDDIYQVTFVGQARKGQSYYGPDGKVVPPLKNTAGDLAVRRRTELRLEFQPWIWRRRWSPSCRSPSLAIRRRCALAVAEHDRGLLQSGRRDALAAGYADGRFRRVVRDRTVCNCSNPKHSSSRSNTRRHGHAQRRRVGSTPTRWTIRSTRPTGLNKAMLTFNHDVAVNLRRISLRAITTLTRIHGRFRHRLDCGCGSATRYQAINTTILVERTTRPTT